MCHFCQTYRHSAYMRPHEWFYFLITGFENLRTINRLNNYSNVNRIKFGYYWGGKLGDYLIFIMVIYHLWPVFTNYCLERSLKNIIGDESV